MDVVLAIMKTEVRFLKHAPILKVSLLRIYVSQIYKEAREIQETSTISKKIGGPKQVKKTKLS